MSAPHADPLFRLRWKVADPRLLDGQSIMVNVGELRRLVREAEQAGQGAPPLPVVEAMDYLIGVGIGASSAPSDGGWAAANTLAAWLDSIPAGRLTDR